VQCIKKRLTCLYIIASGKIQIDRSEEINGWADKIKEVKQNEKDAKIGIVAANNHYGGFGPGTVNMFRESMEMEPLTFENKNYFPLLFLLRESFISRV
jgi:hypothetical protein